MLLLIFFFWQQLKQLYDNTTGSDSQTWGVESTYNIADGKLFAPCVYPCTMCLWNMSDLEIREENLITAEFFHLAISASHAIVDENWFSKD